MTFTSNLPLFTAGNTLPKETVWQSATVQPGTEYTVVGEFPDAESARAAWDRGAVLAVQFYSEPTKEISEPVNGFVSSKSFPRYCYFRPTSATSRKVELGFRTPNEARFMRLAFLSWNNRVVRTPRSLALQTKDSKSTGEMPRRILIYGRVDPNLIDGSSVWLASAAQVMAGVPGAQVDVLVRTPIQRDVVLRPVLAMPNVRVIDPWAFEWPRGFWNPRSMRRLDSVTTLSMFSELDKLRSYDVILVRDNEVLEALAQNDALCGRTWAYLCNPSDRDLIDGGLVEQLGLKLAALLVQTNEVRTRVLTARREINPHKVQLLAPMAPEWSASARKLPEDRPIRIGYSGKFSKEYRAVETLRAFGRLRQHLPGVEFHVFGDKFNAASGDPGYVEEIRRLLLETPGVVWHGGVTRHEVLEGMRNVDIAVSWRELHMDANPEMSTKILEYALNGLPIIMSPNVVQARLFGTDYPGFVSSEDEFIAKCLAIIGDPDLYERMSVQALEVAGHFTIPRVARRMTALVETIAPNSKLAASAKPASAKPLLVVAGHKLNFIEPLLPYLTEDWTIEIDQWRSHTQHDQTRSLDLVARADAIFCEWALGNAVWYSRHRLPGQRLVVRLHAQEIDLPYIDQMDWSATDQLVTICHQFTDDLRERLPGRKDKLKLIYNGYEVERFGLPKEEGAEFTLGLIGIVPQRKAPHLAVEILSELRKVDQRFKLRILGKTARDFGWMLSRPTELAYYDELDEHLRSSGLSNAVIYDSFTDNVSGWFQKVGFVLSVSDYEGSHQAVAEGMGAGSIPVIRNWRGADRLYPSKYVYKETPEAVERILDYVQNRTARLQDSDSCRRFALDHFRCEDIAQSLNALLLGRADYK